jgi:hypothetical protein
VNCYFVYYRVAGEDATVRARIGALLDEVERRTGVRGRVFRRTDGSGTWMETYEGIADPDAFDQALDGAVSATAFSTILPADQRRHVERFVAV